MIMYIGCESIFSKETPNKIIPVSDIPKAQTIEIIRIILITLQNMIFIAGLLEPDAFPLRLLYFRIGF